MKSPLSKKQKLLSDVLSNRLLPALCISINHPPLTPRPLFLRGGVGHRKTDILTEFRDYGGLHEVRGDRGSVGVAHLPDPQPSKEDGR